MRPYGRILKIAHLHKLISIFAGCFTKHWTSVSTKTNSEMATMANESLVVCRIRLRATRVRQTHVGIRLHYSERWRRHRIVFYASFIIRINYNSCIPCSLCSWKSASHFNIVNEFISAQLASVISQWRLVMNTSPQNWSFRSSARRLESYCM